MPRKARKKSGTGVYHVILRGVNRQIIFQDDEDRQFFLAVLAYYKQVSGYEIYGYCLMNNHSHLQLKEGLEQLGTAIKRITGKYVRWYNKKHGRCGHLFQERFKSEPIETTEYFLTALRYILKNPEKANLKDRLDNILWTSYVEFVKEPKMVDVDFVLGMFSDDRNQAVELFREYIKQANYDKCLEYEDKIQFSDQEVEEYIIKLGFRSEELRNPKSTDRDEVVRYLKSLDGITIRQIAKIMGLSKSTVNRI